MTNYIVLDVETTIRSDVHGSSPYAHENQLVMLGTKEHGSDAVIKRLPTKEYFYSLYRRAFDKVIVGHNVGFDLKWIWKCLNTRFMPMAVWDTQQVEYLLSGQRHLYPSLDSLCELYGLPLKPDRIKEYWKSGVDTMDIPEPELRDYLIGDLTNTEAIYHAQCAILEHPSLEGLKELVLVKMDDLIFTSLMEHHGMAFNLEMALEYKTKATKDLIDIATKFRTMAWSWLSAYPVSDDGTAPGKWFPNIGSNKDIGVLLFGGEATYDELVHVGTYKTGPKKGEPKFKNEARTVGIPAHPKMKSLLSMGKTGPKVDDEVLTTVTTADKVPPDMVEMVSTILAYRALKKEISTYIDGYSQMVCSDGLIHASINHCSTATGRQSCTKPNLQNVSGVEE